MVNINGIKRCRVNQEMTQAQLAAACGVTQGTVAMWEKGVCFPNSGRITIVAKALHCSVDDLLRMAEERKAAEA